MLFRAPVLIRIGRGLEIFDFGDGHIQAVQEVDAERVGFSTRVEDGMVRRVGFPRQVSWVD